jgi:hypothetical protein
MSFRIEGDELIEVEEKKNWLSENRINLLTAIVAFLAAALNFFGRWPKTIWLVGIVSGLSLLWAIGSGIRALARRVLSARSDKKYVATEYPKLVQLFERLKQMTNRDNTRAFRYMLYNASSYRVDVVDPILGADYIEGWMYCFEMMLRSRCDSSRDFLARCGHLTALVREFNSNYVIKTQRAVERSTKVPEHCTDDFEDFRERFGMYLHDVEQWAEGIAKETETRVRGDDFLRYVPQRQFERAKSFKKKTAVGA